MSRVVRIPNTADLREIRQRARDNNLSSAIADRRALLALIDDFLGQAHEGVFAEHECPAMFACAYMIAQADEPHP